MDLAQMMSTAQAMAAGSGMAVTARLLPEVLKFADRALERRHELAMMDKQIALDSQQAGERLALLQAQVAPPAEYFDAVAERVSGRRSRVAWIEALNSLIRPLLTIAWCVVAYAAVLWWRMATHQQVVWSEPEYALVSAMISFWFMDRSIRKGAGVAAPH